MLRLPPFGDGQRIGLFGGSFNPAHRGHYMVALYALKRLQLDWVWWLVSPQNPLKDPSETDEYGKRIAYTRRIARHPRFIVSGLEEQINTRYTAQTLEALTGAFRRGHFVWIMGADSLANLHRWHHWTDIMESLPIAVLARPGYSVRALQSPAARTPRRRPAAAQTSSLWLYNHAVAQGEFNGDPQTPQAILNARPLAARDEPTSKEPPL